MDRTTDVTEGATTRQVSFACPKCKSQLRSSESALNCSECGRTYPIVSGIPDFLAGDMPANLAPVYGGITSTTTIRRMAKQMDFFAPIYESRIFVSVLLGLSGVRGDRSGFVSRIASFHSQTLKGVAGSVLDVACGPATYSRRIASPSREVYGIDISMGMLKQGRAYIERGKVEGVCLARARVEELPFGNEVFAGAVCSGSLHLFAGTVLSLREIARTLKPGAPLSVQTFVAGRTVINRLVQGHSLVHTFQLDELRQDLAESGFEGFQPELDGIVLTFRARKAAPRT
jgi:SAM-dependent methyltransferase